MRTLVNGKKLLLEQHGGLKQFWKLMEYCLTTIKNKNAENQ